MSASYAYGGDPTGLTGAYHYGGGGLGTLGSLIPATGDAGAGYGYSSLALPADNDKEYCFPLGAIPIGLTITALENSGFDASAADGIYVVPFSVVEDGTNIGATSFTLTFGGGVFLTASTTTQSAISGTGAVSTAPPGPAVVNLSGASTAQTATSGPGAVSVTPYDPETPAPITVSPAHTVNFDGGTNRVTFGGGTNRVDF